MVEYTQINIFFIWTFTTTKIGHGTHVSGIAASATYGVAKDANLIAVKVLDQNGDGSLSGVLAGFDYIASQKGSNPTKPMVASKYKHSNDF